MDEPKISEIEKLINHFRETGREHEIHEVLSRHGVKHHEELAIEPDTHQINPEALILEKIKKKTIWDKIKRVIVLVIYAFREKWYVRYGTYYVLLFLLIFMVLNAPIIINHFKNTEETKGQIVTYQVLEQQKMEKSAPLDPGEIVPSESQIVIPKIGVKAPIIFTDSNDEKTIQSLLTKGVVHYAGTAKPGEVGNVFITGHSSNFWWIKGQYNYIFLNLNKLVVGDQLKIYHNSNKYIYQVNGIKVVEPTDTSVLAPTERPTLNLMTCTPPGTNWKRLIVTLDQIAPVYYEPKLVTHETTIEAEKLPSTDSNSTGGLLSKVFDWVKSLFSN